MDDFTFAAEGRNVEAMKSAMYYPKGWHDTRELPKEQCELLACPFPPSLIIATAEKYACRSPFWRLAHTDDILRSIFGEWFFIRDSTRQENLAVHLSRQRRGNRRFQTHKQIVLRKHPNPLQCLYEEDSSGYSFMYDKVTLPVCRCGEDIVP